MTDCPRRIQLSRAKGWRMPENTVSVVRPTKWGNPYKIGTCFIADAQSAVEAFRANLPVTIRGLDELRGKNLACWCKLPAPGEPDHCHAAVLLELANAPSTLPQGA